MHYHDFDLWVDRRSGELYPLRAASHTNSIGRGSLELSSPEIVNALEKLERDTRDRDSSKALGSLLYHSLFADEIGALYRQSWDAVSRLRNAGLRIRLRIAAPELSIIPWELLYDGERFLSTSTTTPLTRFIESHSRIKKLKTALPIKVLLVVPEGSGLDTKVETQVVIETLKELGEGIEYHVLDKDVTRQAIADAIKKSDCHIFHFIGQSGYSKDNHSGLLLDSDEKDTRVIKAESFGLFFQDCPETKLVILSGCKGAQASMPPMGLMAAPVINAGVAACIAMQYGIQDPAARLFTREFYAELCQSANHGRVDVAISQARKSICQEFDATSDFAVPALFMRSANGIIFDLQKPKAKIKNLTELHTELAVVGAYANNIAVMQQQKRQGEANQKEELDQQIAAEKEDAKSAKQKIRRRRLGVLMIASLIFVLTAAVWLNLFAVLDVDDWLERKFIYWMEPQRDKPFSDDVRLIKIQEGDNGVFGKSDPNDTTHNPLRWEPIYAKLIRDLADAKAKVVVLDIYFYKVENRTPEKESADKCLAQAIGFARQKGTQVIIGAKTDDAGKVMEQMPAEIEQALNGSWGSVNNLRIRNHPPHLTREAQLGKKISGDSIGCEAAETRVLPSLPLLALMQAGGPTKASKDCSDEEQKKTGTWKQPLTACMDEDEEQVNLRDADKQLVKQIPFYTEYAGAREPVPMIIKLDLAKVWQLESENVTQHVQSLYSIAPNTQTVSEPLKDFCNEASGPAMWKLKSPSEYLEKIVVIGVHRTGECDPRRDIWCVSDSEGGERKGRRYGTELQANILSNLLECVYVRPLSIGYSLLITLFMIALGALLQIRFRDLWRLKVPVKIPILGIPLEIPLTIFVVAVVYFLIVVIAYKQWRVLLNDYHYHIVALWFTYLLVGVTRNRLGLT